MKIPYTHAVACIALILPLFANSLLVQAGEVALIVKTGEPGGRLLVKLVTEADGGDFPGGDGIRQRSPVPPGARSVAFSFSGLAAGRYALAVIHDLDGDGGLTQNLLKIPTEPYGFSNNARGMFGPPEFTAAAFSVPDEGEVAVEVTLK